jgi:hypothetical protein
MCVSLWCRCRHACYLPSCSRASPADVTRCCCCCCCLLQGKYEAALAALRGPLAAAISLPAERQEAEAALLLGQGQLLEAAAVYEAAVRQQPDDWALLLLYLDCLLPVTSRSRPACSSTGVAQMLTGVEASTQPSCVVGGVKELMADLTTGEGGGWAVLGGRWWQAGRRWCSAVQCRPLGPLGPLGPGLTDPLVAALRTGLCRIWPD